MPKLNVVITVEKSFDNGRKFTKEWETGDLQEFFTKEGGYLDRLARILMKHGKDRDDFMVTYSVKLKKEE